MSILHKYNYLSLILWAKQISNQVVCNNRDHTAHWLPWLHVSKGVKVMVIGWMIWLYFLVIIIILNNTDTYEQMNVIIFLDVSIFKLGTLWCECEIRKKKNLLKFFIYYTSLKSAFSISRHIYSPSLTRACTTLQTVGLLNSTERPNDIYYINNSL